MRKNELRLLKVRDFDLAQGTFIVHGKGNKVVVMPIAFADLKDDLHLELLTREPNEYLLHPKWSKTRPLDPSALHLHFKIWLERAGLPTTIKMHELRHSAADNLWRETGNLLLAQQLLRHESVATTQDYLHPSRDDLANALSRLQVVNPDSQS